MAVVYMFTNKINGKKYIGAAKHFKRRMNNHQCAARKRSAVPITRAIRKYGWDNFLDTFEQALHLEKCWIGQLRDSKYVLYNLTDGGEGSAGLKMSEENIEKLRKRMKGNSYGKHKLTTDTEKYCPRCKTVKPVTEFNKDTTGKNWGSADGICKLCARAKTVKQRQKAAEHPPIIPDFKQCRSCGETKPASGFKKAILCKDGLLSKCKQCSRKPVS